MASRTALIIFKTVARILALRHAAAISVLTGVPESSRFMTCFLVPVRAAILSMGILSGTSVSGLAAQEPCNLPSAGLGTVANIRDGRTLLLADGREVRLAAIEVTDTSRDALQSLIEGSDVEIKQIGRERDRYGRVVAFVYAAGSDRSLQEAMLKQGQARVSARVGDKACADLLFSAERSARTARR